MNPVLLCHKLHGKMHGRSDAHGAVGHFAGILLRIIDKLFEGLPGRG